MNLISQSTASESKLRRVGAIETIDTVDARDAHLTSSCALVRVQAGVVQLRLGIAERLLHFSFVLGLRDESDEMRVQRRKRAEDAVAIDGDGGNVGQTVHHIRLLTAFNESRFKN